MYQVLIDFAIVEGDKDQAVAWMEVLKTEADRIRENYWEWRKR